MVIEIVIEKQKFKVIVIVIDYFTPVIATTLVLLSHIVSNVGHAGFQLYCVQIVLANSHVNEK